MDRRFKPDDWGGSNHAPIAADKLRRGFDADEVWRGHSVGEPTWPG